MNIQELLTYIEELSFKNSMFGYDKDDVDIQLDKICDEMEALVAAKDKEISQLKGASGSKAPAHTKKEAVQKSAVSSNQEDVTADNLSDEELRKKYSDAVKELAVVKKVAAEAEQARAALEEKLRETEEALAIASASADAAKVAQDEAEARAEEAILSRPPQTQEEAYRQYLRNAELLCKQLDEVENKRDNILNLANSQAERIITDAKNQADSIVDNAQLNAKRIDEAAAAKISNAEEQVRQILEDGQRRSDKEQQHCNEIIAQKEKLIAYLDGVTGEIKTLIDKVQTPYEELKAEFKSE